MNAVLKESLHRALLDDKRFGATEAHLEAHEVPQWIGETGDQDIAAELGDAISDLEDAAREKFCALLVQLCQHGERMPMQQAMDLLAGIRAVLTDRCVRQAQRYVDAVNDPNFCRICTPKGRGSCRCDIASNE